MRPLLAIALTLLLTASLIGCTQSPVDEPPPSGPETEQPATDQEQTTEQQEPADEPELTEAVGIYTGQIDSNFMEIEVDGVTGSYMYSRDLEWVFAELLNAGDKIIFTYTINEHGQPVVQNLDLADRANMITDVRGIYTGQIDSGSIEIQIDGQYMAFAIPEQIVLTSFSDGDEVIIDYYQEERTGRFVINRMRKAN